MPRAQELIRQDKKGGLEEQEGIRKRNAPNQNIKQQINEVDEVEAIDEVDQYQDEDYYGTDYNGLDELSFPFSEYTEEEDQAYYDGN